jgi:hypothetical protein
MIVTSADAAYCYDRVNHIIMSLVWLVLTNGNIPAIVAAMVCLQTMKVFQWTGFRESKTFFGGLFHFPYMMGLGQGNRAPPPILDPAKCGTSYHIQTAEPGHFDTRPNHSGGNSFNAGSLCQQYQSLYMTGEHS